MSLYDAWDAKRGKGAQESPAAPGAPARLPPGEIGTPYGTKALEAESDAVRGAPQGTRNDQLNRSAFAVLQLAAAGHLVEQDALDHLAAAARLNGLTGMEIMRTISSAKTGAARNPRVKVPDPNESPPALPRVAFDPGMPVVARPGTPVHMEFRQGKPVDPTPYLVVDDAEATWPVIPPAIDWHELWADERGEEWIIEPLLAVGRGTAIYSEPKVGKSLICLELAVAVSMGRAVLGDKPDRPYTVLYVDFENDPRGDVRERLQAMGYGPDDLGNLHYLSFPALSALDSAQGGHELMFAVEHYGAEVVVIDTVSRAIAGPENDNDTWLQFYRSTGLKLKQARVALIRLDHAGKDATKGQRGGSAKAGDVDMVWRLSKVTETTYRLDCEMKRMEIAAEMLTLTLHRKSMPLRHEADALGWRGSAEAKRDELIKLFNEAGMPLTSNSRREAERIIKAHKEANPGFKGARGETLQRILDFRAVSRSDTKIISEGVSEASGHAETGAE